MFTKCAHLVFKNSNEESHRVLLIVKSDNANRNAQRPFDISHNN